jgi:uncharacterized protein (TIGR02757 family)
VVVSDRSEQILYFCRMQLAKLKEFLEMKVDKYNQPSFILEDPVSIPHLFKKKQDIEIAGLFAAIFAWGNRTTIINKSRELMRLMDDQPYDFIMHPSAAAMKKLVGFKHRTFCDADLFYFIEFFQHHYRDSSSLETAFSNFIQPGDPTIEQGLVGFRQYFFSLDHEKRTEKHISSPLQKSTCKRLSMFMRWMVRNDNKGVDFGIWKKINPSQLVCPVDLHVARVAKRLKLLKRKQMDWQAVLELTNRLRDFDPQDPSRYDFALFSLGILEKF